MNEKITDNKGRSVCNFGISRLRLVHRHENGENDSREYTSFIIIYDDDSRTEVEMEDVTKLASKDWCSVDYRICLSSEISNTKAKACIANHIRSRLSEAPECHVYVLKHIGLFKIRGVCVFCMGNEIIKPDNAPDMDYEFEIGFKDKKMDYDPKLPEDNAAAEMFKIMKIMPFSAPYIVAYNLMSIMRDAYEDAGAFTTFSLFIYGSTGTQKTTSVRILTQFYNCADRPKPLTRLDGTLASVINHLLESHNMIEVFDDLYPASNSTKQKAQEDLMEGITRYIGDGITRESQRTKGEIPKCGVIFTGEYFDSEGSTAARLLSIEMTKPDTDLLGYYQDNPLLIPTFYRFFIIWFINNYSAIVTFLKEHWKNYRTANLNVHDRLRTTHFCLNTSYILLLTYCLDMGIMKEDTAIDAHTVFLQRLDILIGKQNELINQSPIPRRNSINALELIKEKYITGKLSLSTNKDSFNETYHHGFIYRDELCLRSTKIQEIFDGLDPTTVYPALETCGALSHTGKNHTKQLNGFHGKRFCCIPLNKLK